MLFIIGVEINSQLILCLWKSQMSKIFPTELVHGVGGLKIMTLINIWLWLQNRNKVGFYWSNNSNWLKSHV